MKIIASSLAVALLATSGGAATAVHAQNAEHKPVFARNSRVATEIAVVHPEQLVCIRKPVLNSRTKMETICKTQGEWKVYESDKVEMKKTWNETGKGDPLD